LTKNLLEKEEKKSVNTSYFCVIFYLEIKLISTNVKFDPYNF